MTQSLYIDPEEEITSILARVKKTQADTCVLVVPSRALILGSFINMKLLARESERIGKTLIIVTQDEAGLESIKKAGLKGGHTVEEFMTDESNAQDQYASEPEASSLNMISKPRDITSQQPVVASPGPPRRNDMNINKRVVDSMRVHSRRSRSMSGIGGASVPHRSPSVQQSTPVPQTQITHAQQLHQAQGVAHDQGSPQKSNEQPLYHAQRSQNATMQANDPVRPPNVQNVSVRQGFQSQDHTRSNSRSVPSSTIKDSFKPGLMQSTIKRKEKRVIERHRDNDLLSTNTGTNESSVSSKKLKMAVGLFVALSILIIAGVLGYVFFPKANIIVYPQKVTHSADYNLRANASSSGIDLDAQVVPFTLHEEEYVAQKEFSASGKGELGSQKASGTVTIQNLYSEDEQPLVATTRLITEDGKLYRLVESVVVPGTSKDGDGTLRAGEIKVTVKADLPGEQFNIGPSEFTIPGFKGTDKHSKITASSEEVFVGGASGESEYTYVSEADVETAKGALEEEVRKKYAARLAQKISADEAMLEGLVTISEIESSTLPSIGTVAQLFTLTYKAKVQYAEFSESDLKMAITEDLTNELRKNSTVKQWREEVIQMTYTAMQSNFEDETLRIGIEAGGDYIAEVNTGNIKGDMVGRSSEEFTAVVEQHPEIEKMDIEFSPGVLSGNIPKFESRVSVEVR